MVLDSIFLGFVGVRTSFNEFKRVNEFPENNESMCLGMFTANMLIVEHYGTEVQYDPFLWAGSFCSLCIQRIRRVSQPRVRVCLL